MGVVIDDPHTGEYGSYVYLPSELSAAQIATLKRNGYNGPWSVKRSQIAGILAQYGGSGGGSNTSYSPSGGTTTYGGGYGYGYGGGGMSAADKRNLREAFWYILINQWGMTRNANLNKLVEKGVREEWTTTTFMRMASKTKDYAEWFPGIRRVAGLTEAEYNRQYGIYADRGKDIKYNLKREVFGSLLTKGIDYEEYDIRIRAIKRMNNNAELFDNFKDYMRMTKVIKPNEKIAKAKMANFVMGRGSPEWEKTWERAAFETGLEAAGFNVLDKLGKTPGDEFTINRKQMFHLLKQIEGAGLVDVTRDVTQVDYNEIFSMAEEVLPLSKLSGAGIGMKDLINMRFGGKGAAETAKVVSQLLESEEAFYSEERATRELYTTGEGGTTLSGSQRRTQRSQ